MKHASHIILAVLFLAAACFGSEGRLIVATVDGSPITKEEFCFALAPYMASLHWLGKSALPAAEDSVHRIVARVLERSIETKVQQLLAKEHALLEDVSYDAFRIALERENESRRVACEKSEVFYGPIQFTEIAFFDYQLSNIVADLKKLFAEPIAHRSSSLISVDTSFADHVRARRLRAQVEINDGGINEILRQFVEKP